jgi:hypothetical protein
MSAYDPKWTLCRAWHPSPSMLVRTVKADLKTVTRGGIRLYGRILDAVFLSKRDR